MNDAKPPEEGFYLGGREVESPLMNAAGSINGTSEENIITEVKELAKTAIGAIKIGSITIPEQAGVGIWEYDDTTKETHNYMGLPNLGKERALKLIPKLLSIAHEADKQLWVSVSPVHNPKYGSSVEQATELVYSFLETDVDKVEVNTACPHQEGEAGSLIPIMGYNVDAMRELAEDLSFSVGATQRNRLAAKEPPDLSQRHEDWLGIMVPDYLKEMKKPWLPEVAEIFKQSKVFSALVASNTIPNQKQIGGRMASLSGFSDRVRIIGREQQNSWELKVGNDMEIISSLGVGSGREMAYRLRKTSAKIGTVAVEGVSFLWRIDKMKFEKAMTWGERVTEMLEGFSKAVSGEEEPQVL